MAADVQPIELAEVVDFAERSRVGDWSLRSALVRYAEGQPERVSRLLESVRRLDAALHPHARDLERRGEELWAAVTADGAGDGGPLVELLRVAVQLDDLGDVMAAWAEDRGGARPDEQVDAVTAATAQRLDELGVPREEAPPRRSGRGG